MYPAGVVLMTLLSASIAAENQTTVLVRVDKVAITRGDVDFAATQRQIKPEARAEKEDELINELIDQQLVRAFLAKKKIEAPSDQLQFQIGQAQEVIRKQGEDPTQLLAKIGYTQERLKRELGLPLAWQAYVRKTVTSEEIKNYYNAHKSELDGTQVRASQILLRYPKDFGKNNTVTPADTDELKGRLLHVRDLINSGSISFEDAAKKYSEAPSAENGGDVGLFGWNGKMPHNVVAAAFELKIGEMSPPVQSPYGFHLIKLTERHPGELSPEDVRPQILDRLSEELWKKVASEEKKLAKIERKSKK